MADNSIQPITGTNPSEHLTGDVALKQSPIKNLYPQNAEWREICCE